MKNFTFWVFFLLAAQAKAYDPSFAGHHNPLAASLQAKGIYGQDDRLEFFEAIPAVQRASRSVPALIFKDQLQLEANGRYYQLKSLPTSLSAQTCNDDPYAQQPRIAFCSGFLLDEDKVASAGHCTLKALGKPERYYEQGESCDNIAFVFDYQLDHPNQVNTRIPVDQVFGCKRVLSKVHSPADKEDHAVFQLDRPVQGHQPLNINTTGKIADHESVAVMGYPYGLPLKIAGGATVHDNFADSHFVTDLDTFHGNSGSPVLNVTQLLQDKIQVEGILVRGETDFDENTPACLSIHRCKTLGANTAGCQDGEEVTRVKRVEKFAIRQAAPLPIARQVSIKPRHQAVGLNQEVKFDLELPQAGYLNVVEVNPEGHYTVYYPNNKHLDNYEKAGHLTLTDDSNWQLKVLQGPYGQHRIYAFLSTEPLNLYQENTEGVAQYMKETHFAEGSAAQFRQLTRGAGAVSRPLDDCQLQTQTAENASTSTRGAGAVSRKPDDERPSIACARPMMGWTQICYYEYDSTLCR